MSLLPGATQENPMILAISLIGLAIFAAFIFYGMRIQLESMLRDMHKYVKKAEKLSQATRGRLISSFRAYYDGDEASLIAGLEESMSSFVISPISLDPNGIVPKVDHVLRSWDKALEDAVARLTPKADPVARKNLTNLLELAVELERIKKTLEHYYISAKRNHDLMSLSYMQIYLPFLMEEAEAYGSGASAFAEGKPIGDALGPSVVRSLVGQARPRRIAEDTVFYEVNLNGRRVIAMKAEGPGGTVGRPGDALEKLLDIYRGTVLIVTVDAALKLESEDTGSIAEGVGVAMGGPGTDRFVIETIASRRGIPIYAVVVKMSEKEAISEMPRAVRDAVPAVVDRVKRAIEENTKPGDTAMVVGVGNTIGVP